MICALIFSRVKREPMASFSPRPYKANAKAKLLTCVVRMATHRQDSSPSIASCSSVLVYVNLPPTTVPTKYISHARRPYNKKEKR